MIQKWTDASHTWEEYWYDALGRRVFTRTRHDLPMCGYPIVCPGFVDRTVWDGDQVIAEQRSSGLDSVTGGAPNFGTVRYVHGLGLDAPVAILDNRFTDARVIHYNWRGLAEASSWSTGTPADLELGAGVKVAWPAGQGVYLKKGNNPNVGQEVTWIGSLPANGQGDAGLVYRRNRFFDPASGRFTQEDPIGLAGGLNLYGFAGGDPVNFSDPFGLCLEDLCIVETVVLASVAVAAVRAIANIFTHRPVLENVGRDGSTALTVGSIVAPAAPVAARVGGAIVEARAAEKAGAYGAVTVGSTLEANAAARIWTGVGARPILANRGTGPVIGRIAADGARVARFATQKANGTLAANLENVLTGSNMHVVVQP